MPDYPNSGRCPVCLHGEYAKLLHSVRKPGGDKGFAQRETDYYRCGACTTIFLNPYEFANGLNYWARHEKEIAAGKPPVEDQWVLSQGGIEMLVLTRHVGEAVKIGDDTEVVLLHIDGDTAKLGIRAPKEVLILREERAQQLPSAPDPAAP